MGERTWYESITNPWLKLNYLSGCAIRPSLSDPEQKTVLVGLPLSGYSSRLHQALLSEQGGKRTPSSRCSPRFSCGTERKNHSHGEERQRVLGESVSRTTPDEVKDVWRNAARIQPVEATEVDGIASFMSTCTRHLEEEREKELLLEAELLQRKFSVPLHVVHTRSTIATGADGNLLGVNRYKSKVLQLRDCPTEEITGSADTEELAKEEKLPSHAYNDGNLSRVLRDFNTAHKSAESLVDARREVESEKLQQLKVLALSDHTELSSQLLSTVISGCSKNLKVLELAGCNLDSTLTRAIGECMQLETLDLSYCKSLKSLSFLQTLTDLRVLRLSGCKDAVTDTLLAEWLTCAPRLEVFHVGNCPRLTNEGLNQLGSRVRCLKELNISDFEALGDEGLASVCFSSPSLEHINFARCGSTLTDQGAAVALASLLKLKHVDSSGNVQIGHQMLAKFKPKLLEYLSVTRSQSVTDETLFALMKRQCSDRLRIIDLRGCTSITRDGIKALIRGCPSLKVVDLDNVPALSMEDFLDLKRDFPHVSTSGSYNIPKGKRGLPTIRVLPPLSNKGKR